MPCHNHNGAKNAGDKGAARGFAPARRARRRPPRGGGSEGGGVRTRGGARGKRKSAGYEPSTLRLQVMRPRPCFKAPSPILLLHAELADARQEVEDAKEAASARAVEHAASAKVQVGDQREREREIEKEIEKERERESTRESAGYKPFVRLRALRFQHRLRTLCFRLRRGKRRRPHARWSSRQTRTCRFGVPRNR